MSPDIVLGQQDTPWLRTTVFKEEKNRKKKVMHYNFTSFIILAYVRNLVFLCTASLQLVGGVYSLTASYLGTYGNLMLRHSWL